MKKGKGISDTERAVLRARGNPYWSLQIDDEAQLPAEPTLEQKRQYLRTLENPAAFHDVMGYPEDSVASRSPSRAPHVQVAKEVSKLDFQRGCKRIFTQYIPPAEKGRLRNHHKEFILRNENSAPRRRGALLAHLQRYDLSSTPGLRPQFNRERDVLTEAKLNALEKSVDERFQS
jgi:hypothetical protein